MFVLQSFSFSFPQENAGWLAENELNNFSVALFKHWNENNPRTCQYSFNVIT